MHNGIGLVLLEQTLHFSGIADINLFEVITGAGGYRLEGFQIARIGQFVEIDDSDFRLIDELAHHFRADKTGAAGNNYFFHRWSDSTLIFQCVTKLFDFNILKP